MKKSWIKKIAITTSLAAIISSSIAITAVSCTNQESQIQSNEKILLPDSDYEQKWNNFLRNQIVNQILQIIYPNKKDRDEYIKTQIAIPKEYLHEIRELWVYNNQINPDDDISRFGQDEFRPHPKNKQAVLIRELFSKNWLWFLFNFEKFVYVISPEGSDSTIEKKRSFADLIADNSLKKQFYRPSSNNFVDYVVVDNPPGAPSTLKYIDVNVGIEHKDKRVNVTFKDPKTNTIYKDKKNQDFTVTTYVDDLGNVLLEAQKHEFSDDAVINEIKLVNEPDVVLEIKEPDYGNDPKKYTYIEAKQVYLMNPDGYFFHIFNAHYFSKKTKEIVRTITSMQSHIYTLPDLYDLGDKLLTKFNLAKYLDVINGSVRGNSIVGRYSSLFAKTFQQLFGGSESDYVIIDNLVD